MGNERLNLKSYFLGQVCVTNSFLSQTPKTGHGPSLVSLHGMQQPPLLPQMPPTLCNPCSNSNNFNSVPLPGPSRWGPRTSCPVHSPFRVRVPNGNSCSGHQVSKNTEMACKINGETCL